MNPHPQDHFATTRWTMVVAAGKQGSEQSGKALSALCDAYWFPLYAYVRRRGYGKEDAEDLTQAFFMKLMEAGSFSGLARENGRFRAFLLAAMKHFLANDHDRRQSLKRGGSILHLSLDWESADARFGIADDTEMPPDQAFDREWAITLLARVLEDLEKQFSEQGRRDEFSLMKSYLTSNQGEIPYVEIGGALGIEEGAVRVRVHRLRKRYREALRDEIAGTLADPSAIGNELQVLMGAFSRGGSRGR